VKAIRRFIIGFFAIIGAMAFFALCLSVGIAIWSQTRAPRIAEGTVLTLDLTEALPDSPGDRGFSRLLFPTGMTLADTLGALEKAGDDPRVKGLIARIGDGNMGLGEVQELRDAIAAFRAKGKRAVAYADTFGELSSGTRSYYLAASFDEIWMQQLGTVGLVGLRAELNFFRGTLDMLGIVPDFAHREEYKDAANTLTETAMTAPEREELQALLQSIYGQIVDGIAADRKIDAATVRALIDRAPLMLDEALSAHLVDHAGDRENAIASLGADAPQLSLARYLDQAGPPHQSGPTIALIYATGLMARGGGSDNPLTGDHVMGADDVTRAFKLAQDDKSVRAILFRINSPGGSAVAAETIWAAVRRARDAGKPVIVSMGDVAGSGGYYVAAPADKIVAEPATLTGSIGVIVGKLVFGGLAKKLGASSDSLQIGANADLFSFVQDFSPSEHDRIEALLDNVYATFKGRVAEGRKLDAVAVEAVAKGRVWSGADASTRGLVDQLGGMRTALDLAKLAAGVPTDRDVTLKAYPTPKSNVELLLSRLRGGGDDEEESRTPSRLIALLRASAQNLDSLLSPPGTLVMPPLVVR
jgi:protease-4